MGEQIDREKIKKLEMERVRRRLKVDPTGEMRMVAIVRCLASVAAMATEAHKVTVMMRSGFSSEQAIEYLKQAEELIDQRFQNDLGISLVDLLKGEEI